jgi:hypothetical protein
MKGLAHAYHILRHHAVKDFVFYVLLKFYLIRELAQGPPLVTSLQMSFFFKSNRFIFLRPVYILLYERGHSRVPPCNVLKNVFFKFMK